MSITLLHFPKKELSIRFISTKQERIIFYDAVEERRRWQNRANTNILSFPFCELNTSGIPKVFFLFSYCKLNHFEVIVSYQYTSWMPKGENIADSLSDVRIVIHEKGTNGTSQKYIENVSR